jgi:hypothetical protein
VVVGKVLNHLHSKVYEKGGCFCMQVVSSIMSSNGHLSISRLKNFLVVGFLDLPRPNYDVLMNWMVGIVEMI